MQLFIAIIILLLSLPVSDMEEMKRLYENEERGIILGASAKFEEAQRVLEVSHSFYYWRNINLHYLVANDAAMGKLETDLAQHFFEALSFSRDNQTEQALKTISVLIVNKPEYIPFYFYRAAWYQDCNNNTLAIQIWIRFQLTHICDVVKSILMKKNINQPYLIIEPISVYKRYNRLQRMNALN